MSFSGDVKDELSRQLSKARHCRIAEIAALIALCGKIEENGEGYLIRIFTENVTIARKYFTLIKKTFNINTEISIRRNTYFQKNKTYVLTISRKEEVEKILEAVKFITPNGEVNQKQLVNGVLIQNACCKRAFIRGAFLAAGSISDPEKFYHFEVVCNNLEDANQFRDIVNSFQLDAKIVQRKKYFVVYLKEGSQIVDILNIMEAHTALMNLENVRILKGMRNSVNRQVNCETANINKTVNAAVKQIEDIRFIEEHAGFHKIPENLQEVAEIRLQYPDATLKELGEMLSPPVGKSGVNHRLRKISNIADELRVFKEEQL